MIWPAGVERLGAASGIDGDGRLLVVFDGERQATPVAAGNIVHLRHNPAASGEN